MIIAPTTTPAALLDQSSVNQSQQQQVQSTETSRKASVTVQLSSEARELAGAENKDSSQQLRQEGFKKAAQPAPPVIVQFSSASRDLAASENKATQPQQQIDLQVSKQRNQAIENNKQQPVNPTTKQPETNKITAVS